MATAEVTPDGLVVSIESWGAGAASVEDDALMALAPMIFELGGRGVSAGAGGLAGGPSATFTLLPGVGHGDDILAIAMGIFNAACEKIGLPHDGIARVDVMEDRYAELELDRGPEMFLGSSELAARLGISRQRVSELRTRKDFPAPVAELKAGPVWAYSSLRRFLETWQRSPGRPRRDPPFRFDFVVPDAPDLDESPVDNIFTGDPVPNDILVKVRATLDADERVVVKRVASSRYDRDRRQHVIVWAYPAIEMDDARDVIADALARSLDGAVLVNVRQSGL
jgi:hypothetical protein